MAAVCFGAQRQVVFAHCGSGTTVGFRLGHGDAYAFGADINHTMLHGVAKFGDDEERISVVVWGNAC